MADDRSDFPSDAVGRKQKPPVIELTATDVTAEEPATKRAEETPPKSEAPRAEAPPDPPAPAHQRHSTLLALLAGVIGLLAGALVLSLIFLFAGDGVRRLTASAPETAAAPAEVSALRERAQELARRNSEIEKRTGEIESQLKNLDLSPLKARLDSLESGLKDIRDFAEQAKNAGSASGQALVERLDAIEAQIKQSSRPQVANAAEVAALGALQDAIARGAPFKKELDAARAMLGDAGAPLDPLESSAASGLPTMAELRRRFAELAPKLARAPQPDGGYLTRLWSSASRLIDVRPVGEVAGTSAGAVVARIETRLARNDLAAALGEAAQLPPSAKAQAADWIAAASRRREAETAVKHLMDAALARAAPGPGPAEPK